MPVSRRSLAMALSSLVLCWYKAPKAASATSSMNSETSRMNENIIDRLDIRDLAYRYSDAITQRDWSGFENLFWTDDAIMEALHKPNASSPFGRTVGKDAVLKYTIEGRNR